MFNLAKIKKDIAMFFPSCYNVLRSCEERSGKRGTGRVFWLEVLKPVSFCFSPFETGFMPALPRDPAREEVNFVAKGSTEEGC